MTSGYLREYRGGAASVSIARHAVLAFAQFYGFSGVALDDIETAVGEALANAAEHGAGVQPWFAVRVDFLEGSLLVEVKDHGTGFDHAHAEEQIAERRSLHRGFGITLMRKLMDRVEYCEGGTRVRFSKRLLEIKRSDVADLAQSEA